MNIWEFRKLVRDHRKRLNIEYCCPLGAAMYSIKGYGTNPVPAYACNVLDLIPRVYATGVANGWDNDRNCNRAHTTTYIKGYRYGRRMHRIAMLTDKIDAESL